MITLTRSTQLSLAIITSLLIGLGIQAVTAWTGPTAEPPKENVSGPLTTGDGVQAKRGWLTLNNSTTTPISSTGLFIANGRLSIGELLTAASPANKLALKLNVNGKIGATEYCDQNGENCIAPPFLKNLRCEDGKFMIGIDGAGLPVCKSLPSGPVAYPDSCKGGQVAVWSNGSGWVYVCTAGGVTDGCGSASPVSYSTWTPYVPTSLVTNTLCTAGDCSAVCGLNSSGTNTCGAGIVQTYSVQTSSGNVNVCARTPW